MTRVVTFGEVMLRLKSPGFERLFQSPQLEATFGGAEANVAVSLSQFGLPVSFVTALPSNPLGESAVSEMRKFGVETSFIKRAGDRLGIYFLESGSSQRASKVTYDRAGSSIAAAKPGDLSRSITSPNVTTRVISNSPQLRAAYPATSPLLLDCPHSIDRLPHLVANAIELPRAYPFRRCHPGTSARDDARDREIRRKIRKADPAAREKSHVAVWSRHRLEVCDPAQRLRGKELNNRESTAERELELGRRSDPWKDGKIMLDTVVDHRGAEPRCHEEFCSRAASVRCLARSQDRTRSDEHVRTLGRDLLERFERPRCAESDFGAWEPAFLERVREWHRLSGVIDHDDRNQSVLPERLDDALHRQNMRRTATGDYLPGKAN